VTRKQKTWRIERPAWPSVTPVRHYGLAKHYGRAKQITGLHRNRAGARRYDVAALGASAHTGLPLPKKETHFFDWHYEKGLDWFWFCFSTIWPTTCKIMSIESAISWLRRG
jgi:hypothetical protein